MRRSDRNRAWIASESMPRLISFSAACCSYWPSARSASHTVPMPPRPSSRSRRQGPIRLDASVSDSSGTTSSNVA
jgi:hypothetical protein